MVLNQETLNLSPYMAIYNIVVPKNNMLCLIGELFDFTFIHEDFKSKYCLENGRNAVPSIRMFKYLATDTNLNEGRKVRNTKCYLLLLVNPTNN